MSGMTAPLILFLGKPGAGKGTQAALLAQKTDYLVFKTSDELRRLAREHPVVGEKIVGTMQQGGLVPYWLVMHLWLGGILSRETDEGLIIDGAVRRPEEATLFHDVCAWFSRPYRVFFLNVSDEEMKTRIGKRATIEGRSDDNDKALIERMNEYATHTSQALAFFKTQGTYVEIAGEGSVDEVRGRVMEAFTKMFPDV